MLMLASGLLVLVLVLVWLAGASALPGAGGRCPEMTPSPTAPLYAHTPRSTAHGTSSVAMAPSS
ncbi:hypothetical protein N431DRAFT_436463 [Stipitochalara longipes BDJ]|nr:hypothetical protein N431DRAFT_436463 [Stipitochalara longipes BDJ]